MAADGGAGYFGTFVIAWSQCELDGIAGAPPSDLAVGAHWCWHGEPVRVDGPADVLRLCNAEAEAEMRLRAARAVRKILGDPRAFRPARPLSPAEDDGEVGFEVTDGVRAYAMTLAGQGARTLLVCTGRLPPRDTDLWVVGRSGENRVLPASGAEATGGICLAPGTAIETPRGPRRVEEIRPGDLVTTLDDGAQEVIWTGGRRVGGARLHAMPHLRPVRIAAGATGGGGDLLVLPGHRLLIRDRRADRLFGDAEVLMRAADLAGEPGIRIEAGLRALTYIHLMTERHQIIVANGVETETFHPAEADLDGLGETGRETLLACIGDPGLYGPAARRGLTAAEAAILRHDRSPAAGSRLAAIDRLAPAGPCWPAGW